LDVHEQFQYHDLAAVLVVLTHEHDVFVVFAEHDALVLVVVLPVVVFVSKLFVTQQLYVVPD
jgi:hypothetical protein